MFWLYPGCEVHSSSSVQQQGRDIHVAIVSSNVQGGETALFMTDKENTEQIVRQQEGKQEGLSVVNSCMKEESAC